MWACMGGRKGVHRHHYDGRKKDVSVYVDGDSAHEENDIKKMLRQDGTGKNANYASSFETFMRDLLEQSKIPFLYEKVSFMLTDKITKRQFKYTPDFITELETNGKTVIVETHGAKYFDERNLVKFSEFMKRYGARYHLILVTDISPEKLERKMQQCGISGPIASEIWHTNGLYGKSKEEGGKRVDLEAEYIAKMLDELKSRSRLFDTGESKEPPMLVVLRIRRR